MQDDIVVRGMRFHQRSLLLTTSWLWPTEPGFWIWLYHEGLEALFSLLLLQQCSLGKYCDSIARIMTRPSYFKQLQCFTDPHKISCKLIFPFEQEENYGTKRDKDSFISLNLYWTPISIYFKWYKCIPSQAETMIQSI